MIIVTEKIKILTNNTMYLALKWILPKVLLFYGKYNVAFVKISITHYLNFYLLRHYFSKTRLFLKLNVGFIKYLILNGLGFKATRKLFGVYYKYWRFNVGHSHVFQYFTPRNIIMKIKHRLLLIFGLEKSQIVDITKKIKSFHVPDTYKGVGLKYPSELIRLKKGKTRQ